MVQRLKVYVACESSAIVREAFNVRTRYTIDCLPVHVIGDPWNNGKRLLTTRLTGSLHLVEFKHAGREARFIRDAWLKTDGKTCQRIQTLMGIPRCIYATESASLEPLGYIGSFARLSTVRSPKVNHALGTLTASGQITVRIISNGALTSKMRTTSTDTERTLSVLQVLNLTVPKRTAYAFYFPRVRARKLLHLVLKSVDRQSHESLTALYGAYSNGSAAA